MYLIEIQKVNDTYKRRTDSFYTVFKKTKEEAIKFINEEIHSKCMDYGDFEFENDELYNKYEEEVVNSPTIRNDLIEKYLGTEFTQELYKIIYWIYELDDNMEKKLIFTNLMYD